MNELLSRLGREEISPFFDECYEKAKKETGCPVWLTPEFLREATKEQPYFGEELEELIAAIDAVKENPDLVLFARTLYHMLAPRMHHESIFGGLAFPTAPEGADTLPYDIFTFYPLFAHIREAYRELSARGIDREILAETAKNVGGCIGASRRSLGRFGFTKLYFLWCTGHKNGALFRIGRFSFEVRENIDLGVYAFENDKGETKILMSSGHKVHTGGLLLGSAGTAGDAAFVTEYRETDTAYIGSPVTDGGLHVGKEEISLRKAEWTPLYRPGDNLISVHIPSEGSFDPETVGSSLDEGKRYFKALYPEKNLRAYMCISWLLSPELVSVLKPESNILSFGNRYERFPVVSEALDVFHFIFHKSVTGITEEVIDSLTENNSLERGIKALYKNGGFIHESGGFIPF